MSERQAPRAISLGVALIPVVFLVGSLATVISLPPHIPLISAAAVAGLVATFHGVHWKAIEDGMVHGINLAMGAILILMVVGTMIGTWILGGVVPTMIYYGLKILSPGIFLVATMIICSIVSLGTGSSWSTADRRRRRAPDPATHGRRCHHFGCVLRRQDVAAIRHHELGSRHGRNGRVLAHPAHDVHDHAGVRACAHPIRLHWNPLREGSWRLSSSP